MSIMPQPFYRGLHKPKKTQDGLPAQVVGEAYYGADDHRDEERKEAHEEEIACRRSSRRKIFWPVMQPH